MRTRGSSTTRTHPPPPLFLEPRRTYSPLDTATQGRARVPRHLVFRWRGFEVELLYFLDTCSFRLGRLVLQCGWFCRVLVHSIVVHRSARLGSGTNFFGQIDLNLEVCISNFHVYRTVTIAVTVHSGASHLQGQPTTNDFPNGQL
jgi:hypothetical protein